MPLKQDKNFDNLIDRFEKKVYQTAKGDWRLKLLKEDLAAFFNSPETLAIWDAGCGFAQISLALAKQVHRLTLRRVGQNAGARQITWLAGRV